MKTSFLTTWLLCIGILATVAQSASPTASFSDACKLYEVGKFSEAAAAYESILQSGKASAPLYFNLGNAWFKSGQIGKAIACYRLAESLAPRDPDIKANLRFARAAIGGKEPVQPSLIQRAVRRLTLNEWTALTASAAWIWLLLLAAGRIRPLWESSTRPFSAVAGLATGVLAIGLGLSARSQLRDVEAVILQREVVVRFGPLDKSASSFTLPGGSEVRVLDQHEGWVNIEDGNGRRGWVTKDSMRLIQHGPSSPVGVPKVS